MTSPRIRIAITLLFVSLLAGCATTQISDREETDTGQLPRPNHIWVYDFAATADDVQNDSSLYGQTGEYSSPQTSQQLAEGRQVGSEIATELVTQINAMGLFAELAGPATVPEINDVVVRGYLLSVVQGERDKRVIVGFGDGGSELKAAVEGFVVTANGLEKLGGGDTDATGNKTPGAGVGLLSMLATHNPLGLIVSTGMKVHDERSGEASIGGRAKQTATEIANLMKIRFQEEGWIN